MNYTRKRNVESPGASNEAVVERLGRIEALLEEQGQRLHSLFVRGAVSSSFDGSHISISPKVSIDATAADTETSDTADTSLLASHTSGGPSTSIQFPRSPFHLAPEFPPVSTISLGGLTAAGTPGSTAASSPPPPIPSPIVVNPLLGIGASHQHSIYQQQQQLPFFHQHAPIPYHGTSTATSAPAFGLSAGTYSFPSGSGLTPSGSRSFLTGKTSSVPNSDISSLNFEHGQFLIPHEHSTAANTLLSLPLVNFFLEHRQKVSNNKMLSRKKSTTGAVTSPPTVPQHSFSYARTYFFDLETSLPLPPQLNENYGVNFAPAVIPSSFMATSQPAMLDDLVRNYFAHVHPSAPLFSIAQFRQWNYVVCRQGSDDKIETAICLVVWALGSLVPPLQGSVTASSPPKPLSSPVKQQQQQQQRQAERDRFALSLFQPALKIIIHHALWEFGPASLTTCQALLLAASYFSHIGRPLHNARMVYLASRLLIRVIEDDRAAELDVPRSGIEPLADRMPLPASLDPDDEGTEFGQGIGIIPDNESATGGRTTPGNKRKRGETDIYTATVASEAEYGVNASASGSGAGSAAGTGVLGIDNSGVGKMLPISAELNRQLEAWYHAMPDNIRPPLNSTRRSSGTEANSAGDAVFDTGSIDIGENDPQWHDTQQQQHTTHTLSERVQILRIHYYAARHIIHRPFVLGVAWQQQQQIQARESADVRSSEEMSKTAQAKTALPRSKSAAALVSSSVLPQPSPADVLEKCAICVDSCVAYLVHVLPLLERRSPYLWSFCQSSMACLLVLLVADACPGITSSMSHARQGAARSINIGLLRDGVASRLRQWATPGSSFEAELRIVESFPMDPT
ncbi:hypothetical protein SEUCBS140593_001419 [Sporothrix eucalyptigena]|uniref:C6 zinc finger domain containing protein n=1 Tax=Sporothrix eucalyptigena TaxID=1812306 RepID=A0ABP0AXY8_9PEZI